MLKELLFDIGLAIILAGTSTIILSIVLPFLRSANAYFLSIILPSVVLILTQAVSSDLYLSLGLIGALSIVRYRTPVKSQIELAHLFLLIGIGVSAGVNVKFAYALVVVVAITVPAFWFCTRLFPNLVSFERRFNSSSRVEVFMKFEDVEPTMINLSPKNGNIIRIDQDKTNLELAASFANMKSALDFVSQYKSKITNYSILNA